MQRYIISEYNKKDDLKEEEDSNNINTIINKYESQFMTLKNNKKNFNNKSNNNISDSQINDSISHNSKRTKNTSSISDKVSKNNKNIKIFEEDLNKNNSSSMVKNSIKPNSKKINPNDIEIIIENHNFTDNINIVKKNNDKNQNIKNKENEMFSIEKNKTEKNNNSIYDTSFNVLFNPFDNAKFFFNK